MLSKPLQLGKVDATKLIDYLYAFFAVYIFLLYIILTFFFILSTAKNSIIIKQIKVLY